MIKNVEREIRNKTSVVKTFLLGTYKRITTLILNKPEQMFFGTLGVLFLLIIAGRIIGNLKTAPKVVEAAPKKIGIFAIGTAPKVQMTAKIEKSGVVKIVAQSPGVVQAIYKSEGETVSRGQWLFWLSTNYQGGTVQTAARQIAQENFDFVSGNYDAQKEAIAKQREAAEKSNDMSADLRDISQKSIQDTQNVLSMSENIEHQLDVQIQALTAQDPTNADPTIQASILQAKQGRTSILASMISLRSSLRNAEYQTDSNNPPTALANLQKDIALKQLEIQEKSLDLNREISRLNLVMAQISESLMYPASPVTGTVDRVYVQVGQVVNPGQVLAAVTGDTTSATAIVTAPRDIATNISRVEPSVLIIGADRVETTPLYISKEPTDLTMHVILFAIPPQYAAKVGNGASITIEVPISALTTTAAIPYIPLDAVYQTQEDSYVFVASKSADELYTAASRAVDLGPIYGQYVEVKEGLKNADFVITTRNVVDKDRVTFK